MRYRSWALNKISTSTFRYSWAEVNLFTTKKTTHCPLWIILTPPAPLGLHGTDGQGCSSASGNYSDGSPGPNPPISGIIGGSILASLNLVLKTNVSPGQTPWEIPIWKEFLSQVQGSIYYH